MNLDWDGFRFFLAVVEHGSTRRAAGALGVEQTTCARRIAALEAALGVDLFERRPAGFTLTDEGRRLEQPVRRMSAAAAEIAHLTAQIERTKNLVIRVSVGDLLVEPVVQPALTEYRRKRPDVRVELAVETRYVDIMSGEADIALRPGDAPDDPRLVIRRLGSNPMAVYCTAAYAERYGLPGNFVEHLARPFACMEGRALSLITELFPGKRPRFVATSLQPLVEAVASGDFAALLPSLHADRVPGFIRCFPIDVDTGSVWLVYHPGLRGARHARDLLRALTSGYRKWLVSGPGGPGASSPSGV